MPDDPAHLPAIGFKSSTLTLPVLIVSSNDLSVVTEQIQQKIQLAPEFFKNSPVVLDVQFLVKHELAFDFNGLVQKIRGTGLMPIGLRGGGDMYNEQALALGIPAHPIHNAHNVLAEKPAPDLQAPAIHPDTDPKVSAAIHPATVVSQPIRSGQRVYAQGDLIVLAQVSPGAEIIAEGNIHVYNTLKGRALAGVHGNLAARIFCSDLQAELISIAGTYKISEDMRDITKKRQVQVYLHENTLIHDYMA